MAEKACLRIGEVARLSGLHPKAIRYYEHCGLIKSGRSPSRYRLFQEADLTRLKLIKQLRRLGFSLSEINQLLSLLSDQSSKPIRNHRLEVLLAKHLEKVGEELQQLSAIHQELTRRFRQLRGQNKASQASCCEPFCGPETCGSGLVQITGLTQRVIKRGGGG